MKNIKFLVLIATLAAAPAWAQEHEIISTATQGVLGFTKMADDAGEEVSLTALGLEAGYRYMITEGIQLATRLDISYGKFGEASATELGLAFGPAFNFGGSTLSDSMFAEALFGITRSSASLGDESVSDTSNSVLVAFGKRFALTESITYSPSIQFEKSLEDGAKPAYGVEFLSFSLLL
jgi:hypothetical protein